MSNPEWTEPWEWEDCAKCGATPVRELIDDDPLCQDCCDEWAQNEGIAEAAEMAARNERKAIIARERSL